jgi:hypothetical protein
MNERWNALVIPGLDPGIHQKEKLRLFDGLPEAQTSSRSLRKADYARQ